MPPSCRAATDTLASSHGPFRASIVPMDLKRKISAFFTCREIKEGQEK